MPPILVVRDRHNHDFDHGSASITTEGDFIYARNANLGIQYFGEQDIILCNDDLQCIQGDFFHRLASVAAKFPRCGILSPLIDGGVGNVLQRFPADRAWNDVPVDTIGVRGDTVDSIPICFPCVWLSRAMINQIGLLDENFTGYGEDDVDYCLRARKAGWLTMVTRSLHIKHGTGGATLDRGNNWSCSFAKEPDRPSNRPYLLQKYSAQK